MPNKGKQRPNSWTWGPPRGGAADPIESLMPTVVRALLQQMTGPQPQLAPPQFHHQQQQWQQQQQMQQQQQRPPYSHRSQQHHQGNGGGGGGANGRGSNGAGQEEWACATCGFLTNRGKRKSCYKCGVAKHPTTQQSTATTRTTPTAQQMPTARHHASGGAGGGSGPGATGANGGDETTTEITLDHGFNERVMKAQRSLACPSQLAVVKLAATAAASTDDIEMELDNEAHILTPELLKLYRTLQSTATGKKAEEATAHLRAHEKATAARDALKPVADIQLVGLQPAQVLPRVEAKLVDLQRQRADAAARWASKEAEDDELADKVEREFEAYIKAYTDKHQEMRAVRKAERAKWAAAHEDQRARIDAKIVEVTKLRDKAQVDPASLVKDPSKEADAPRAEDGAMDTGGGPNPSAAEAAAAAAAGVAAAKADTAGTARAVAADTVIRPVATLPVIATTDEAELVRLAKAQAVVDQAAQQDAHVDLSLADLGLTAEELTVLIGCENWREYYPADAPQPQDDWPLPKRIIALLGKAVSRVEVSTAMAQTAQAAAAAAIAQATAAGKSWQLVPTSRRPKPY